MTAVVRDETVVSTPPPARPRRAPRVPRPARRPRPQDEPRLLMSSSLAMVSLLCLWMVFQLAFLGGLSHARSQDLLYREYRSQLANAIAPIGPVTPAGDPVAVLRIPSIGLEQTVVEGTGSGDTLVGPGHLRNTVLPGQVGTSVVMGRAQTYGGPFRDLGSLRTGDPISVVDAQGTVAFTVLGVRRAGDPLPQPLAAGAARLTLVTTESTGLAALGSGPVLYVDAEAAQGLPAPAGLPAAVPASERPLSGDTGALPLLVLHLAALLALSLGLVAARQRWSGVLVWVVATPVVLAVTWSTTDVVMRLLPNIL